MGGHGGRAYSRGCLGAAAVEPNGAAMVAQARRCRAALVKRPTRVDKARTHRVVPCGATRAVGRMGKNAGSWRNAGHGHAGASGMDMPNFRCSPAIAGVTSVYDVSSG